jgi:hypothetical protein
MPLGKIKRGAEDENAVVRYLWDDEDARLRTACSHETTPSGLPVNRQTSGAGRGDTRSGRRTVRIPII